MRTLMFCVLSVIFSLNFTEISAQFDFDDMYDSSGEVLMAKVRQKSKILGVLLGCRLDTYVHKYN